MDRYRCARFELELASSSSDRGANGTKKGIEMLFVGSSAGEGEKGEELAGSVGRAIVSDDEVGHDPGESAKAMRCDS